MQTVEVDGEEYEVRRAATQDILTSCAGCVGYRNQQCFSMPDCITEDGTQVIYVKVAQ